MIHAAYFVVLFLAFTNTTEAIIGLNWGRVSNQRMLPSQVVDLILQNGIRHARIFASEYDQLLAFAGSGINLTMGISDPTIFADSTDDARAWVEDKASLFVSSNTRRVIVGSTVFSLGLKDKHYLHRSITCLMNMQTALNEAGFGYLKATFQHGIQVLKPNTTKPSEAEFRDEIKEEMTDVVRFLQQNKSPYVLHMFPISDVAWFGFDLSYAYLNNQSTFAVNDTNGHKYTNMFEFTYDSFIWALRKLNASDLRIIVGQVGWPTDGYPGANATAAERYFKGLLPFIVSKKGTPMRPGEELEVFIHAVADEPKMPYLDSYPFNRHWGIYRSNGQPKYKIDLSGQGLDVYPKEVKGIMRMPQRWCVFNDNLAIMEKVQLQKDRACSKSDCTSTFPGGSCSGLTLKQNISYAFNMMFQFNFQDEKACIFENLGLVTTVDPSTKECLFPVEVVEGHQNNYKPLLVTSFAKALHQTPNAAIAVAFLLSILATFFILISKSARPSEAEFPISDVSFGFPDNKTVDGGVYTSN